MTKKDEFWDWLSEKYWKAHKNVEDLEHQRRYVEEMLRGTRVTLEQLERLRNEWLHEQEEKARRKKTS